MRAKYYAIFMTLRPRFSYWAQNKSMRTMTISFGYTVRTNDGKNAWR